MLPNKKKLKATTNQIETHNQCQTAQLIYQKEKFQGRTSFIAK
jgi:hypothetical protein